MRQDLGAGYGYGIVAFLADLNENGNVLLLEGTSMAGTEAICDFALDESRICLDSSIGQYTVTKYSDIFRFRSNGLSYLRKILAR